MDPTESILGVILAGGASRRFGSDKALALLAGMPLIAHVANRARAQVTALAVSGAPFPSLDLPVIADRNIGEGPLSGILSSLAWAEANGFSLIASFPCDGPFFPSDLVTRLSSALSPDGDCAMVCCGADRQYTYGVWRTACLPMLERAFAAGQRSLHSAADALAVEFVEFVPASFLNINRPEDLVRAEITLAQARD